MKKINIIFTAGLAVLMAITSCKKLDLYPYDSIEVSQSFKSVKDAAAWNLGLYAQFRARQYGSYTYYSDIQADQFNAGNDYGNRNGFPHRWGSVFGADDGTLAGIWAGLYSSIANVNTAIAGFKTIPAPAAAMDVALFAEYQADNYLARAAYYHDLVTRYAKPYETATAATDLGVPLVLEFKLNEQPSRATVQAVYTQILSDIATAKGLYNSAIATATPLKSATATPNTYDALISTITGKAGSNIFTLDVAYALEARVKLYSKDFAGAYTAANTVISSGRYPLITTEAAFKSYWYTDGTAESIMQCSVVAPSELANAMTPYINWVPANSAPDPDFIPSAWVYGTTYYPTGSTDIRKNTYFLSQTVKINTLSYTLVLLNKFPGNPAYWSATYSNYVHQPKAFRVAELYLIAAEAASTINTTNSLTALNALRTARGAALSTGAALVQDVRDERFKELIGEGFRLHDLSRWHLGFTRTTPQNLATIVQGPEYNTLTIAADNPKFVWGIPTNDIIINTNLVQNPGW